MHDTLIIIGASGHGKVAVDVADKMNQWKEIMFLDDSKSVEKIFNYDVVGTLEMASKYKKTADFFVAIGSNSIRKNILEKLSDSNHSIATLIHPTATIGMGVRIDVGTIVMPEAVINSSTTIGRGCIINTSSIVEHDNVIEDFVHISPGVKTGGTVFVGKNTWLGIGSIVINNVDITDDSIIGAGAVVIEDITQSGTYLGAPVRRKLNV